MKVAITSTGNNKDSMLDTRFGRCSYFAIYDTENQNTEFIENTNKESAEGAGPASVNLIALHGVKKVVSGEFGGKVKNIFESLEIQFVVENNPEKTISEIIDSITQ